MKGKERKARQGKEIKRKGKERKTKERKGKETTILGSLAISDSDSDRKTLKVWSITDSKRSTENFSSTESSTYEESLLNMVMLQLKFSKFVILGPFTKALCNSSQRFYFLQSYKNLQMFS